MLPTISILCSSYNSSRYIEGYCHSLNAQLLPDFDVIYVDAASTDHSLDKFRSFGFRDGIRIKILECDKRIPVYQAWNLAIDAANSEYCMNYNTDDRLYPAALTTMLGYANAMPDKDIIYSRCFITSDPDHRNIITMYDWPEYSHDILLKGCICGPFPLLKRQSIIDAGMFDPVYTLAGDYEMWLRMSKAGLKFKRIPESIGSYFRNPEGLSTSKSLQAEMLRQMRDLQERYK